MSRMFGKRESEIENKVCLKKKKLSTSNCKTEVQWQMNLPAH